MTKNLPIFLGISFAMTLFQIPIPNRDHSVDATAHTNAFVYLFPRIKEEQKNETKSFTPKF